jgi:hypothetical protein
MTESLIEQGKLYFDNLFGTDVEVQETTNSTVCVVEPSTKNKHLYPRENFAEKIDQEERFTPK